MECRIFSGFRYTGQQQEETADGIVKVARKSYQKYASCKAGSDIALDAQKENNSQVDY